MALFYVNSERQLLRGDEDLAGSLNDFLRLKTRYKVFQPRFRAPGLWDCSMFAASF